MMTAEEGFEIIRRLVEAISIVRGKRQMDPYYSGNVSILHGLHSALADLAQTDHTGDRNKYIAPEPQPQE